MLALFAQAGAVKAGIVEHQGVTVIHSIIAGRAQTAIQRGRVIGIVIGLGHHR